MKTEYSLPLTSLEVGNVYPVSPHAVVVHLPLLTDVIRYETGCPVIKSCITVGYPRFVLHYFINQIQEYISKLLLLHCPNNLTLDQLLIIPCCNKITAEGLLHYVSTSPTEWLSSSSISNHNENTNFDNVHTGILSADKILQLASNTICKKTEHGLELSIITSNSPNQKQDTLPTLIEYYSSLDSSLPSSTNTSNSSISTSSIINEWTIVVMINPTSSFCTQNNTESLSPAIHRLLQRTKEYQQHTGCRISSRQAEDILYNLKLIDKYHTEEYFNSLTSSTITTLPISLQIDYTKQADFSIRSYLQSIFPRNQLSSNPLLVNIDDIRIYNSGMASFTALFYAIQKVWLRKCTSTSISSSPLAINDSIPTIQTTSSASTTNCPHHPYTPHRDLWLQLGWVYLDTTEVMKKMYSKVCTNCHPNTVGSTTSPLHQHRSVKIQPGLIQLFDPNNEELLISILQTYGPRLAGIIAECPTNPLVQTCNIIRIVSLIRKYSPDTIFIIDPTMMGLHNGNVLPLCDVIVVSLTKYSSNEGDIMAGAIILNPDATNIYSVLKDELFSTSPTTTTNNNNCIIPWQNLYYKETLRLAYEIAHTDSVMEIINKNTCALVDWFYQSSTQKLRSPLRKVHWAYADTSKDNYSSITNSLTKPGSMITIELDGTWISNPDDTNEYSLELHQKREQIIEKFYNNLHIVKGPSFGTKFTIASPFTYLAHYDLVSTTEGRKYLYDSGVNPYLIRISIGCESITSIIQVFSHAFECMGKE